MFIPLRDDNSLKSILFQYVTVSLIAINVLVYLFEVSGLDEGAIRSFGVTPRALMAGTLFSTPLPAADGQIPVVEGVTLFTYMFFHADIFHLLGNMLFLWVFGDNVEDAMGHAKFLFFYLACGVFAGLFHAWMLPGSEVPLIGASGRRDRRLPDAAPTRRRLGAGVQVHPDAHFRRALARHLDRAAGGDDRYLGCRADGVVGPYRRASRGRRADPRFAPPRRAAVRPRHPARMSLERPFSAARSPFPHAAQGLTGAPN